MFKEDNDDQSPKTRKIEIKPLNLFREYIEPEQAKKGNSLEEDHILLQKEVDDLYAELTDLKVKKDKMLNQATTEVKQEKESWEEEKQQLIEETKKEGFQAGFQQGEQKGFDQYTEVLSQANEIVKTATDDYHQTLKKSEQDIIKIAVYIAEKIIKDQLDEDANKFTNIVEAAVNEIQDQSIITIYLHPDQYGVVSEQKQELEEVLDGDAKIEIYADHKLDELSCVIKHPFGEVDASVDTQLSEIRRALEEFVMENES